MKEAKESLDKALKLNPENNEAHYIYGKVLLKEKNYKKAEEITQKAIEN